MFLATLRPRTSLSTKKRKIIRVPRRHIEKQGTAHTIDEAIEEEETKPAKVIREEFLKWFKLGEEDSKREEEE